MPAKFLPSREAELVEWLEVFNSRIQNRAFEFGLTQQQVIEFQASRNQFTPIYNQSQDEATRTRVVIEQKNVAKRNLIALTRELVRVCEAWPLMTNAKRLELGITPRNPRPSPSPVPTQRPFVKVLKIDGRQVTINLQSNSSDRTRPVGVDSVNIFVAYGPVAPTNVDGWDLYTGTNRARATLTLDKTDQPTKVWICASWLNRKKEAGPACSPVGVDLAATSAVPQPQTLKVNKAA